MRQNSKKQSAECLRHKQEGEIKAKKRKKKKRKKRERNLQECHKDAHHHSENQTNSDH